jgi:predicted O-methyltransferase YrrM
MKPMTEAHLAILRRHMVEVIALQADLMSEEIGKSTLEKRVLDAMLRVRRHLFVPPQLAAVAYHDTPLPIGFDKTVSQPFICALMTDLLDPQPNEGVLEVGTGLGYQAAVLAELARQIWTIEVVEEFASHAEARLTQLGYGNVAVRSATAPAAGPSTPLSTRSWSQPPQRRLRVLCSTNSPLVAAWSSPSAPRTPNSSPSSTRQTTGRSAHEP